MAMTTAEVQAKIDKLQVNMDRLDSIVNGNNTTQVTIDSGTVPSISSFFKTTALASPLTITTSTANSITVNTPTDFQARRIYSFTASNTNTSAATITVTGSGTYNIVMPDGTAIPANTIYAGGLTVALFTGTEFQIINSYATDVSLKNLSQAWAEGTLPGGSGTKSSKEWATNAQTWAEGTLPGGSGTKSSKEWALDSQTSATSATNSANIATAAAAAAGVQRIYTTYALANAALGSLTNGWYIEIIADETRYGERTRYEVVSGALVYRLSLTVYYSNLTAYRKVTAKLDIMDFVARSQWEDIADGTPTDIIKNDLGQDAWDACMAAMPVAGGDINFPSGTFRLSAKSPTVANLQVKGIKDSTLIQTTSATANQFTLMAEKQTLADLKFVSTVTRTAGTCVLATNYASNSLCENISSDGAFTLWGTTILAGNPSEGIYHTCKSPRARNMAKDGIAYLIDGGYALKLDNAYAERVQSETNPTNWPENGIRILQCGDINITGVPEILGCRRPLIIMPGTGKVAASVTIHDGYFGTSYIGSLVTAEYGGTVVTLRIGAVWIGENSLAGTNSLEIKGHHANGVQGVVLDGTHFPLSAGNGFQLSDNYVRDLQIIGGWADGCVGSGYAMLGGNYTMKGVLAGGYRFGGNAVGFYIDNYNNLTVDGTAGNNHTANLVAGATASSTVVYNVRQWT